MKTIVKTLTCQSLGRVSHNKPRCPKSGMLFPAKTAYTSRTRRCFSRHVYDERFCFEGMMLTSPSRQSIFYPPQPLSDRQMLPTTFRASVSFQWTSSFVTKTPHQMLAIGCVVSDSLGASRHVGSEGTKFPKVRSAHGCW